MRVMEVLTAVEAKREERQVENCRESVAIETPCAEELERTVAMILASVDGGKVLGAEGLDSRLSRRDASPRPTAAGPAAASPNRRRDALQAGAIPDELLEQQVRAWEVELGFSLRGARPAPRKTDWTMEELYDTDFAEPKWVVHELLPVGLASLAGRPKVGKSWLALQLAAAVATGQPFLDWEVEQGIVFFIALEDPPRRLKERLKHLGVPRSAEVQFDTDWPLLNAGAEGLYQLQQSMAEWQPRLVVIDTLARAFDRRTAWSSLSEASSALAALLRLAHEQECCILTLDHHKKPGAMRDVIDDIVGSTGKAAVIDTAWGLYKERGKQGAMLEVTGRDIEPRELAIEFDGSSRGWQRLCEAQVDVRTGAEQEVYELLEERGEADAGTLAKGLSKDRSNAYRALKRLQAKGYVQSREVPAIQGGGKRVVFWIPQEDAAEIEGMR